MEWRNKSTHDYQLFFSEQEAFLAIMTVSAFINILLDQMVEKMAFEKKATQVVQTAPAIRSAIQGYESLSPFEQVLQLIVSFAMAFQPNTNQWNTSFEAELIGELAGYIKGVAPQITIELDATITIGRYRFTVDLLVGNRGEKVIIEIKRPGSAPATVRSGEEQLFSYLAASDISKGILLLPPSTKGMQITFDTVTRLQGSRPTQVTKVYPITTPLDQVALDQVS